MEIAPGIHRIAVGQGQTPGLYATNTYLILGTKAGAFVDAGWNRDEEIKARLDYLRQLTHPPITVIAITHRHPDHAGGALAIQKATSAQVVTAPLEKEPIEASLPGLKVGHVAKDGEAVDLGSLTLEFVHAPGHTLGSLALFLREHKALFTGDNVMGVGTSVIGPDEGDLAAYLRTMEKFLRYQPAVIYPGHGPPIKDPQAKLTELVAHRREREQQILSLLKERPRTVEELMRSIYNELNERIQNLARDQVKSHLLKLEREDRVARGPGETYVAR